MTPKISIHAPRVGCDGPKNPPGYFVRYFNPRTPCGVRPGAFWAAQIIPIHFNPRTPCGVRPAELEQANTLIGISIHAPRVGCDHQNKHCQGSQSEFQSTHPVWGATAAKAAALIF